MTVNKIKENIALFAIFALLLIPFLGPYRYYNATGFMNDMLTVSCITLLLASTLIYCKKLVIPNYLSLLAVGGVLLVTSTFFNSTYNQTRLHLIIWLLSAGLVSICIASIKCQYADNERFHFKLASYLSYSSFIIAIIAFLAFYFANPFVRLTGVVFYYNPSLRMDSFLGQPNLLAIILFLGVVASYYIIDKNINRYRQAFNLVIIFVVSYCLFATLSRVAVIALSVFILYAAVNAIKNNEIKNIIKFVVVIILAYLTYHSLHSYLISLAIEQQWVPVSNTESSQFNSVNYNRGTNLDHKIDEIKRALTIFSQYPITGAGFGRYGYYSQQLTLAGWPVYIIGFPYHSHNIVSQVLAEFGAIGGIVLLAALVLLIKLFIKSFESKTHLFMFGLIAIFGLNALFEYALWNLNFAALFFILIAGFSNDQSISVKVLKTPLLNTAYSIFFIGFTVVLISRWSIITTLNTIFSKPENVVYAETVTEDRLMGLDFSSIYLAGVKLSDPTDKNYENEVIKMEKWRPTDMVYYRKVQLDIGNNNFKDITDNIQKTLLLGSTVDILEALLRVDCQDKNQACRVAESYLKSLKNS